MNRIVDNFSCSDPDLSPDYITEDAWSLQIEGSLDESTATAAAVIQLLVILIGLPWNFIVATVIFCKKLFKEPSYIFLLSLILSDLLVCLLPLPFNVASGIKQAFTIGSSDYSRCQVCQYTVIITITLIYVSVFSSALMSADRLFYIKYSFIYSKYITPVRALVAIAITWIFCFLISIPPLFGFGEIKFSKVVSSCSIVYSGQTRLTANINYIVFIILIGTIPRFLTVVVNIWLLAIACKSARNKHSTVLNNNNIRLTNTIERATTEQKINTNYHKKQMRLTKVFGIIFGVHAFIWLTTVFITTVTLIISPGNVPYQVLTLVFFSFVSLPAIHPMLETCLVGKAKTVLIHYLCCCCRTSTKGQLTDHKKGTVFEC